MATTKNKGTAPANARNRSQRQLGTAEAPKTGSTKRASNQRFPGETPLTGEDRPSDRTGGKKHAPNRR